ncbi:MAG: Endolytic murein transglycosylase [Syntrophomonadaceae bacterium]|nr:Endolytic murein transglycosylase [Bacillota bacterium]
MRAEIAGTDGMRQRTLLRLAAAGLLLLAIVFGIFVVQISVWLKPVELPAISQEAVLISIPAGSSSLRVASILAEKGLVRHALVFRYFAKYRGLDQQLQAGDYMFSYGMTMDQLLQELSAGNVYRPTVTVTIPEGFLLEQIAQRLAQEGLVDHEEFMLLATEIVPILGRVEAGQRYALEGYLFPDTYEFSETVTPREILTRMQSRLEEVLTLAMRERAKELGLDIHQVITLASLVEREVQSPQESPLVAAVIHNRLAKGMRLQICASVIYALGEHRDRLLYADLEVESPFNTYRHVGLPPGPIAAPGKRAIMAVLYPADVDYLFYVLKEDGSGTHYFGSDYAEHQANIRRARSNR